MKHEANALRKYKSENDSLTAQVQKLEEEAAKNAKLKAKLAEMHRLQAENSKLEQSEKDFVAAKPRAIQTRINTRKPSNENIQLASNIDLLASSITHSGSLSADDLPKSLSGVSAGALDIVGEEKPIIDSSSEKNKKRTQLGSEKRHGVEGSRGSRTCMSDMLPVSCNVTPMSPSSMAISLAMGFD